jgi:hypothetical protein
MLNVKLNRTCLRVLTARSMPVSKYGSQICAMHTGAHSEDAQAFMLEHQVMLKGVPDAEHYKPMLSFADVPFHHKIKQVLERENFSAPSPIQSLSWPIALEKKDLISVAKTGSGNMNTHNFFSLLLNT